jgi:hypothetical protein
LTFEYTYTLYYEICIKYLSFKAGFRDYLDRDMDMFYGVGRRGEGRVVTGAQKIMAKPGSPIYSFVHSKKCGTLLAMSDFFLFGSTRV